MPINYTERGRGLHDAIAAAGQWLRQHDGAWMSSDDVAVQSLIDNFDVLADAKATKIAQIKADGLMHVHAMFPAIATMDDLDLVREFWLSIAPAARSPTANWAKLINTVQAAKTGIASVNAALTVVDVNAIVVVWP